MVASILGQKLDGKTQTPINEDAEIQKAIANGLPTPDNNGILSMTMFLVNAGEDLFLPLGMSTSLKVWYADGAGPFQCNVTANDSDDLVPSEVIQDVTRTNGRSNAKNQAFPFTG